MEPTKKTQSLHINRGDLGWRVDHSKTRAHLGRKGLADFESRFDEYMKEAKTEFLIDVFDKLFGYDRKTGEKADIVYLSISKEGETEVSSENPSGGKHHVYYNSHYYIELVPNEWTYSEPGEEFFDQQLNNVKSIRPSYTQELDKDIEERVSSWKDQGFITVSLGEGYHPGVCRYCGKRINPPPKGVEVEYFSKNYKERSTPGRSKWYCCDEHQERQRLVEDYFEDLRNKGKLTPQLIEIHDHWCAIGVEIERLIRPNRRCAFCGGVIPDGEPFNTRYCDGVCLKFKTCKNPKKYTHGGNGEGGNNEYCVRECPEREVKKNRCKEAFRYRLDKERKVNPDITDKELTKILNIERRKRRELNGLRDYINHGLDPLDETSQNGLVLHLREELKDEYVPTVTRLLREMKKENTQK